MKITITIEVKKQNLTEDQEEKFNLALAARAERIEALIAQEFSLALPGLPVETRAFFDPDED